MRCSSQTITIPALLKPLIEAFAVESPKPAKALIKQTVKTIYGQSGDRGVDKEQIEDIYNLMKAIKPIDELEVVCAAQIIIGYLLGMYKLSLSFAEDQRLGLKLLKFSIDAMERLQAKR